MNVINIGVNLVKALKNVLRKNFFRLAIVPEWSKGSDLRSAVFVFVGSNPTNGNAYWYCSSLRMILLRKQCTQRYYFFAVFMQRM